MDNSLHNKYIKDNLQLRDFQIEAVNFLISKKHALLALPTGTGKTITAFTLYANLLQESLKDHSSGKKLRLLFITEKPLIPQVISQDLPNYFNLPFAYVYNNTKNQRILNYKQWVANKAILVINYQSLRIDFDDLGRIFKSIDFNFITILDEATNFKSPNADVSHKIKLLCKASKRAYAMTATPASSGLYDIFNIMNTIGASPYNTKAEFDRIHCDFKNNKMFYFRAMDKKFIATGRPSKDGKAQQAFVSLRNKLKLTGSVKIMNKPSVGIFKVISDHNASFQWIVPNKLVSKSALTIMHRDRPIHINVSIFDDKQRIGYKNIKVFREVSKDLMFVRAKKDIVKELPPITISYRYCQESDESKKAIKELYESDKVSASQIEIASNTPQVYCNSVIDGFICDKFQQLAHFIRDDIPNSKVLVYFPYTSATRILKEYLDSELECKVAYATGEGQDNNKQVKIFTEDPECRVLIGTRTLLKGFNIQKADYIAILQSPYTASDTFQLWGRINRIGGDYNPKNVIYFLNEGTRDELILENVIKQINHIKEINPQLVEDTIGLLKVSGKITEEEAKKALDNDIMKRKTMYI